MYIYISGHIIVLSIPLLKLNALHMSIIIPGHGGGMICGQGLGIRLDMYFVCHFDKRGPE